MALHRRRNHDSLVGTTTSNPDRSERKPRAAVRFAIPDWRSPSMRTRSWCADGDLDLNDGIGTITTHLLARGGTVSPMRVHLCGVRGSTPAPGSDFAGVGGHTSCVAIAHDGDTPRLVLDAGTGLRTLSALLEGRPFVGTIVLSHLHWDHMMGLPFFAAGDHPDARVRLLMPTQGAGDGGDDSPEALLERMMSPPSFPITPAQLRGEWCFETYDEGELELEGFTVTAREVPHTGGRTMGLRVAAAGSSVTYMPDHAPHQLGPGASGVGELHPAARELALGTDLLIHDAQYTRTELPDRFTWGHAAADYPVELAEACGVGRVLMFHHDPMRTDAAVAALHAEVTAETDIVVDVAVEGTFVDV
jgi:phosphoribosyl 1,2-cyclic phosphodiesterase